jgi:phosphatidylglycerophosphatase A
MMEVQSENPDAIASPPAPPVSAWAWAVATLFGIGHLRPGPGTWASAATLLLWTLVAGFLPHAWRMPAAAAIAAALVLVGIPACTRLAHSSGREDPQHAVVDEAAGQMIALIAVPLAWTSLLASFILFRGFDIVKPPPLRRLERLPEGAGVMLDDVGAGLYALAAVQLLIWLGPLA